MKVVIPDAGYVGLSNEMLLVPLNEVVAMNSIAGEIDCC